MVVAFEGEKTAETQGAAGELRRPPACSAVPRTRSCLVRQQRLTAVVCG
ncbi:MAG: hypothetical protein ACLRWQ_19055 [Flavonifractor plautii]